MEVSPRLTRWIVREFPEGSASMVVAALRDLPEDVIGGQEPERVQAALVIRTAGDWHRFQQWLTLARSDWRDALVGAGLGDEDWPARLDALLGTGE